ncbi:MAG: rhodanese-like domain-containing protein [Patescibacteria group bacterium]|nr:rhodanese-like domain-containing protein [Patescibacteria group bacterium]
MTRIISTEELKQKLDDKNNKFYLVDVLEKESFDAEHIPESLSLPYDLYFIDSFSKKITPDKNAEVIVYCASESCKTSELAADVLEKAGYMNVLRYSGGLAGWQNAGQVMDHKS